MASRIRIHEVSPRDGLQNESTVVSTEAKLGLIQRLVDAGFRDIEATSFVSPRYIPQLADAEALLARLPTADVGGEGIRYWALVPNAVGLERALAAGVRHVATFLSSSETHNRKNVNRTIAESLEAQATVIHEAVSAGARVRSYISTVFGCPFEGDIPVQRVVDLARALRAAGAHAIALGDTTGMADPEQVKMVVRELVSSGIPVDELAIHLHDTRGTALANAYAAWQEGITAFDGSIAGIGGCPYAPGAAGNASTEDLLYLFARLGAETGIDLDRACAAGHYMEIVLGRPLPGRYHQYWLGKGAHRVREVLPAGGP
jgi:hydroxymethylglutaryl-CoA lyase